MVSLGTAQSNTHSKLASAVASNPGASAVIAESEISYTTDGIGNTEVISENTRTIVLTVSPGESIFVFPPATPASRPDNDPDGGSAQQFSFEALKDALAPTSASVYAISNPEQNLSEASFADSMENSIANMLKQADTVLVNSQEQFEMIAASIPLVPMALLPRIVVQDDISVPEQLAGLTISIGDLQRQQLVTEQPAAIDSAFSVSTAPSFRLQDLEDSGELDRLNAYVQAKLDTATELPSLFEDLSLPTEHDQPLVGEIVAGEILTSEIAPDLELGYDAPIFTRQQRAVQEPGLADTDLAELFKASVDSDDSISIEISEGRPVDVRVGAPIVDLIRDTHSGIESVGVLPVNIVSAWESQLHSEAADDSLLDERLKRLVDALQNAQETRNGTLIGLGALSGTPGTLETKLEESRTAVELDPQSENHRPTVELSRDQVESLTGSKYRSNSGIASTSIKIDESTVAPNSTRKGKGEKTLRVGLEEQLEIVRNLARAAIDGQLSLRGLLAAPQAANKQAA